MRKDHSFAAGTTILQMTLVVVVDVVVAVVDSGVRKQFSALQFKLFQRVIIDPAVNIAHIPVVHTQTLNSEYWPGFTGVIY